MWFLYGSFVPLSDSPRERQLQLLHSLWENDTHGQRRVINKEIGGDEGGKEEVRMYLWKSFKWDWIIDCEGSSGVDLPYNFWPAYLWKVKGESSSALHQMYCAVGVCITQSDLHLIWSKFIPAFTMSPSWILKFYVIKNINLHVTSNFIHLHLTDGLLQCWCCIQPCQQGSTAKYCESFYCSHLGR